MGGNKLMAANLMFEYLRLTRNSLDRTYVDLVARKTIRLRENVRFLDMVGGRRFPWFRGHVKHVEDPNRVQDNHKAKKKRGR